jgi:probable F420-dependent oxidoreductase
LKFVVSAAYCPPVQLCELARACDDAGFEAIAVSDHMLHPKEPRTPYPYTPDGKPRWEPFTPWPDPWVAISAMAAVTQRLRFLTTVYVLPMRNPLQVAKTVATAAVMSGGRVSLGIGAGWMREEFEAMGQEFESRGRRMNEMLEVIRKLFAGDGYVEHHGEFYDFEPLEMRPLPSHPVPILVGGFSKAAKRRAATLGDGWISDLHTTQEIAIHVAEIRKLRVAGERATEPFTVVAAASDAYTLDGYRRLEDVGVTHVQTLPWKIFGSAGETVEEKRAGVARFGDEIISKLGQAS